MDLVYLLNKIIDYTFMLAMSSGRMMLVPKLLLLGTYSPGILNRKLFVGVRRISGSGIKPLARNVKLEHEQWKAKVVGPNSKTKPSRQERIDRVNIRNRSKLQDADNEFGIFNAGVTKVLDLGFVPGNWSEFARYRLCQVHGIDEDKFHEKCHILGFDILFGTPPLGVSSMQGNIFSKSAHDLISMHFKDIALRNAVEAKNMNDEGMDEFQQSYYFKEQSESFIEQQVSDLSEEFDKLTVTKNDKEKEVDYKPDLILSDLSAPFMQEKGFFNNTNSKPYLRTAANPILSRTITDEAKAAIDSADAALILACDVLKKGGTLVLRLAKVDPDDAEIALLHSRLDKVFSHVYIWNRSSLFDEQNYVPQDKFYVCLDKIDDVCDKKQVFMI